MGTTLTKLNYLLDTKEAIKNALVAKGVSVAESDTFRSYAEMVKAINGYSEPNDVNLYDYDGTCVYSYSASDFLNLTELPPCPIYARFASSRWNWTLNQAKEYVQKNGFLDIGALYTLPYNIVARFYLSIKTLAQTNVAMTINFDSSGDQLDWGDGSALENLNEKGTYQHTYQSTGDYCITILGYRGINTDEALLGQSEENPNTTLVAAELGSVRISGKMLANCSQLQTICCSGGFQPVVGLNYVGLFANDYNLRALISPNGSGSYNLVGHDTFKNCTSLAVCALGRYDNVVRANTFYGCSSLKRLCFTMGKYLSGNGYSGFAAGCTSLSVVTLPSNLTTLPNKCFIDCKSLMTLKMPSSLSEFESGVIDGCICLKLMDFRDHTSVPTINSDTFTGIPSDCKIIVPDALYDSWIAASNWSTYASQIIKASKYDGTYENGVYVQHIDGILYTSDEWSKGGFANSKANGIAVITDTAKFVISKVDNSTNVAWASNTNTLLSNVGTVEKYSNEAKKDLNGFENTKNICAVSTSGAANLCSEYSFPNGQKGYLPSAGEWSLAYGYKDKINEAIAQIGATTINTSREYWTSTQISANYAWIYRWLDDVPDAGGKINTFYCRAFAQLIL